MANLDAYSRQNLQNSDIERVCQTLTSDYLTQGPAVAQFEQKISEYCEVPYCVAVSSATAGLHLALMALEVNHDSLVWTSANTFASTANVARLLGADIDFIDIDQATWMISPQTLEKKLIDATGNSQPTPSVVILVHFAGISYDLQPFVELAEKYQFRIIEDAAHAFGASYGKYPVGSGAHSDLTVFSFHAIKPMTTGEGGAVTTTNPDLFKKIQALRTHGVIKDSAEFRNVPDGAWYYEQHTLGLNYRITDFQCALGLAQIDRYPAFLERRREIVDLYNQHLPEELCTAQAVPDGCLSAHHIYPVLVSTDQRRQLFDHLRSKNIGVNVHYIPVYRHPYHADKGTYSACPNTDDYYSRTISLPLHTHLSDDEVGTVCTEVKAFLETNTNG